VATPETAQAGYEVWYKQTINNMSWLGLPIPYEMPSSENVFKFAPSVNNQYKKVGLGFSSIHQLKAAITSHLPKIGR
jgi:hypothetical protein